MIPTLIYCADGNKRFPEIASRCGYNYGAQLPNTIYYPPYFVDQNWRNPDRPAYMAALAQYRPALATVLDWEHAEQLPEVLSWAEEAAQYVSEAVIIIPKVVGGIRELPRQISGRQVRLGYSAASSFSGTPVTLHEFRGWPVHCLGGSPARQFEVAGEVDLQSADGNFIQNMATKHAQFYSPGLYMGKRRKWPGLREAGIRITQDAPYIAFELTCIAVPMAWNKQPAPIIWEAQLAFLRRLGIAPESTQDALFMEECTA